VTASPYVAVHRHGDTPRVEGGVLIQVPECDNAADWIEFYALDTEDASLVLFKAVDDEYRSGHGMVYAPGATVTAPDFEDHDGCGNGLHFCPRPFMGRRYHHDATKYVACRVKVADIVVIRSYAGPGDKVKARSCEVLFECDADGAALVAAGGEG
jgi:hypothetical protein